MAILIELACHLIELPVHVLYKAIWKATAIEQKTAKGGVGVYCNVRVTLLTPLKHEIHPFPHVLECMSLCPSKFHTKHSCCRQSWALYIHTCTHSDVRYHPYTITL